MYLRLNVCKINLLINLSKYGIYALLYLINCNNNLLNSDNELLCSDDELDISMDVFYEECESNNKKIRLNKFTNKYMPIYKTNICKVNVCDIKQGFLELINNSIILRNKNNKYILNKEIIDYKYYYKWDVYGNTNKINNYIQIYVNNIFVEKVYSLSLATIRILLKYIENLDFSTYDELNIVVKKSKYEIMKCLNISESTINKAIRELQDNDIIVNIKNGKYMINPSKFFKGNVDSIIKLAWKYNDYKSIKKDK